MDVRWRWKGVKIGTRHEKTFGDRAKCAVEDGDKGDVGGFVDLRLLIGGLLLGGLEFAIDGYVNILIEAGIGFESRFRLGSAFEDAEIVLEEAYSPFVGFRGMVVLQRVCPSLRLFDEVSVGDASYGPVGREMVGIELEEAAAEGSAAGNDMLLVTAAFFDGIDFSDKHRYSTNGLKIAHTSCGRRGERGRRHKSANTAFHPVNYACF